MLTKTHRAFSAESPLMCRCQGTLLAYSRYVLLLLLRLLLLATNSPAFRARVPRVYLLPGPLQLSLQLTFSLLLLAPDSAITRRCSEADECCRL